MSRTRFSSVFLGPSGERIGRAQEIFSKIDTLNRDRKLLILDALVKKARNIEDVKNIIDRNRAEANASHIRK